MSGTTVQSSRAASPGSPGGYVVNISRYERDRQRPAESTAAVLAEVTGGGQWLLRALGASEPHPGVSGDDAELRRRRAHPARPGAAVRAAGDRLVTIAATAGVNLAADAAIGAAVATTAGAVVGTGGTIVVGAAVAAGVGYLVDNYDDDAKHTV